ncbi:MAG: glycosyltransferase [Methanomassiliicoccales archaeon]|nr:glycosyltransferase [Methanomassiliicoccales archaeon]
MLTISAGVCAYNEEKNILQCLRSLTSQTFHGKELVEMLVISSGSTDRTDELVQDYARNVDGRVRLIRQEKREGKNSAVNAFMVEAKGDVLFLANADNVMREDTFDRMAEHFNDPSIGMVGGHPVPVNDQETFMGFAVHMLWDMHHRLSLIHPKVGEIVAFRNLGFRIPTGMGSDEDLIRREHEGRGLKIAYESEALIFNRGPTTVRDFFIQRTRVNIGERYMKRWFDYDIPTWDKRFLINAWLSFVKDNASHPIKMAVAMSMEAFARVYAALHVQLDKGDRAVWQVVESTKEVDSKP